MSFAFHAMRANPQGHNRYSSNLYEKVKERTSKLMSGKNNPFYGKGHFGKDNGFYGKTHTDEWKKRHSEILSKRFSGKKNPFYGKTQPQWVKDLLKEKWGKPIEVDFDDGTSQKFVCKRDLGVYLGKSKHLGAKLNNPKFRHLWEKYGITNIKEIDKK